jgi:uncharacterized protein (DUF58 family)
MSTELKKHLDSPTIDKIKRLDVRARLVVEGFISGQHRSPYQGYAVEFATHREYAPGDDLRHIDWKVWSRTDRLYVKQYEEETNLQCTLVVDASRSMAYGGAWRKYDYAATAAASLAYLLHQKQDAVGLITFSTKVEKHLPPGSNASHLKALVHALETSAPSDGTDLTQVFGELAQQVRRRGIVVLISDLFAPPEALAKALKQFRAGKQELIVLQVLDDDELNFPFRDDTLFRALEGTQQARVEPRALRASYLTALETFLAEVRRLCAQAGVDHVLLHTKEPLDAALGRYLAFRQRVRRAARPRSVSR